MKKLIGLIFLLMIYLNSTYSQEMYTAKKGSRFFPGHLHAVITVDSTMLSYELFNHWYVGSYAQERDITIPLSDVEGFNSRDNSIKLEVLPNKVKLKDKKYGFNKKVKDQKLCASVQSMRNISYAVEVTNDNDISHFQLYEDEDLSLSEEAFKELVNAKLILRLDSCNSINTY